MQIHTYKIQFKIFLTTGPESVFPSGSGASDYQITGISGYPGRYPAMLY